MSDFITLSCPSCGAKLEITQDIDRFACSNCGREHIVQRSGGIVSLSPVVDAINQVKSGVDKTAAELALTRLPREIAILANEKNNLLQTHPYPEDISISNLVIAIIIGSIMLFISIFAFSNSSRYGFCFLIPEIIFIIIGIYRS